MTPFQGSGSFFLVGEAYEVLVKSLLVPEWVPTTPGPGVTLRRRGGNRWFAPFVLGGLGWAFHLPHCMGGNLFVCQLLTSAWRAIAPLMTPWCAEGDVPTAANLNLFGCKVSHVAWHSDDEHLFGDSGDPKLIVSVSLGSSVSFKWKAKSCSLKEDSCWLDHGDLPVMDGSCQDEFLHCTSPSLADRWVNMTYRWIRYHSLVCRLTAGVLGSMPT